MSPCRYQIFHWLLTRNSSKSIHRLGTSKLETASCTATMYAANVQCFSDVSSLTSTFKQVISTAWDSTSACLFTGDETGRLRCWSLRKVLEALGAEPSREPAAEEGQLNPLESEGEGGWGGRLGEGEGGCGAESNLRTQARR